MLNGNFYVVSILRTNTHEILEKEFKSLPKAKTYFDTAREMSLFFIDEVKIELYFVDKFFRVNSIEKYDSENPTEEEVDEDFEIIDSVRLLSPDAWEEAMQNF